jgi:hypothetical protein
MSNRFNLHPANDLVRSVFYDPVKIRKHGSEIIKRLFLYLSLAMALSDLSAQPFDLPPRQTDITSAFRLPAYLELGQSNISDGIFLKSALLPTYEFGKYTAQAGIRFDIVSNNENVMSGLSLMGSRIFMIRSFPLDVKGLFIRTAYSGVIHENKWGLLLNSQTKHFRIGLGTNFRTLALNNEEAKSLNDSINTSVHENWNMLYKFSYYIKPIGNKWNIYLSVTNIDYFNISQETNPIFKIGALYDLSLPVTFFIDSSYQSAGILNMNIEYFGFFIKTGIIWNLQKKSN